MLKKVLFALCAVTLGIFASGLAQAYQIDSLGSGTEPTAPPTAVFVNPGGLGDALIYGYYNVRDNRENYFNVVNTDTTNGVRARIRFIEAPDVDACGGSVEILDFDICLSPGDVWTGIIKNVDGAGRLFSPDDDTAIDYTDRRTRTDETANPDPTFAGKFPQGVGFKYGSNNPISGIEADDTLEGYFIVIAENLLAETPGNCGNLTDVLSPVEDVLFGMNYAVDMDSLATFANTAVALGDFSNTAFIDNPTEATPNLASCTPDCFGSINPINYILTKSNLYGTYALGYMGTGAKTEMVVNFPTRRLTCQEGITIFDDDRVLITAWSDDERSRQEVCEFSPCTPGDETNLPYEVNVLNLNNSDIFTSTVEVDLAVDFDYGWLNINLVEAATSDPDPAHATLQDGYVSLGLPAIGYVAYDIAGQESTHMLPLQYRSAVLSVQLP